MVPADSPRIPRVPGYSGAASPRLRISLTGLSPSAAPLSSGFCYAPSSASPAVLQPRAARRHAPGLGWCGFARRYFRNHWFVFSSSGYLDVSVPRVRPWLGQVPGSRPAGCPIRKSAHQRVFAPTRGLSQLVTSFVASESLGILHAPFSPFLIFHFAGSHSQDTAVARASFSCPPFARMGAAGVKSLFLFCVALEFCSLPPIFL